MYFLQDERMLWDLQPPLWEQYEFWSKLRAIPAGGSRL